MTTRSREEEHHALVRVLVVDDQQLVRDGPQTGSCLLHSDVDDLR